MSERVGIGLSWRRLFRRSFNTVGHSCHTDDHVVSQGAHIWHTDGLVGGAFRLRGYSGRKIRAAFGHVCGAFWSGCRSGVIVTIRHARLYCRYARLYSRLRQMYSTRERLSTRGRRRSTRHARMCHRHGKTCRRYARRWAGFAGRYGKPLKTGSNDSLPPRLSISVCVPPGNPR